jgi:hypothetical protein
MFLLFNIKYAPFKIMVLAKPTAWNTYRSLKEKTNENQVNTRLD